METITELKELIENPRFNEQKNNTLEDLSDDMIDRPIVGLINGFNNLPYCFTLQSCYGHFIYPGQKGPNNLEPLPELGSNENVKYRIAYIALCIENSLSGRVLLEALNKTTTIEPDYIQFCCAEWFWTRQVNSYVLQVEPERFKHQDTAVVNLSEALLIEKLRNRTFIQLSELLQSLR